MLGRSRTQSTRPHDPREDPQQWKGISDASVAEILLEELLVPIDSRIVSEVREKLDKMRRQRSYREKSSARSSSSDAQVSPLRKIQRVDGTPRVPGSFSKPQVYVSPSGQSFIPDLKSFKKLDAADKDSNLGSVGEVGEPGIENY